MFAAFAAFVLRPSSFVLRRVSVELLRPFLHAAVDACALGLFDLFEALLDVLHDSVHVVAAQSFAALLLETLQEVAQAGHLLAGLELIALLHQLFEGALHVAVSQHVLRNSLHDRIGVEWHDLLGTIPAGISEYVHDCLL